MLKFFTPVLTLFFISAHCEDSVEKLVSYSGIEYELKNLPQQFLMGLESSGGVIKQADPELYDQLAASILKSFDYDRSILEIKQRVRTGLSLNEINTTLDWLTSGLGKKITALENELSEPDNMKKAMEYSGEVDKDKMALIEKMMTDLKTIEKLTEMTIQTTLLIAYAMAPLQSAEDNVDLKGVEKQVETMRPMISQQMKMVISKVSYYGYRELSFKNLQQYTDFNLSEAGLKYNMILQESVINISKRMMVETTKVIVKFFEKKGKKVQIHDI